MGGTTDQVGNPWALDRSAGGSSGGSAAALAASHDACGHGHGYRRLAADPLGALRHLDAEAVARPRLAARGRTARADARSRGPDGADARRLRAAARRALGLPARCRASGVGKLRVAVSPRVALAELDADVAAGLDGALAALPQARGGARRAAAARRAARRRRRLHRGRAAPRSSLPPPLRRAARALPPLDCASWWRTPSAGALRGGVPRRAGAAGRDDRRLGRLARRAPDRRGARADGAGRRAPARRRLRPGVHRRGVDLADALLGLDGLPGRCASGGCRRGAAASRWASRSSAPPGRDLDVLGAGIELQAELGPITVAW